LPDAAKTLAIQRDLVRLGDFNMSGIFNENRSILVAHLLITGDLLLVGPELTLHLSTRTLVCVVCGRFASSER
jgi:hypothetical protein